MTGCGRTNQEVGNAKGTKQADDPGAPRRVPPLHEGRAWQRARPVSEETHTMLRTIRLLSAAFVAVLMLGTTAVPAAAAGGDEPLIDVADRVVECHDLDGENYCFALGFTDVTPGTKAWRQMWRRAERENGKAGRA